MWSDPSSPIFSHELPASRLRYTPSPQPTWRPLTFSPVPTQTTSGFEGVEGDRADRVGPLSVEDRRPCGPGVLGLPHAPRTDGDVPGGAAIGVDRDIGDPAAHERRADRPQLQPGDRPGHLRGTAVPFLPDHGRSESDRRDGEECERNPETREDSEHGRDPPARECYGLQSGTRRSESGNALVPDPSSVPPRLPDGRGHHPEISRPEDVADGSEHDTSPHIPISSPRQGVACGRTRGGVLRYDPAAT